MDIRSKTKNELILVIEELNLKIASQEQAIQGKQESRQEAGLHDDSLTRLTALLNAIPDLIFVFDSECRFIDYHSENLESLYLNPKKFLGKKPEEVLPQEIGHIVNLKIKAILSSGKPDNFTYNLKMKGETHYFESRGVIYGSNRVLFIVRDITEIKKAEFALKENTEKYRNDFKLFRSIFESPIDIIIFAIDKNYCYTAFTKFHKETIKKIWGTDIQIGMNILEVIRHPEDRIKAKNNFDRALRGEYFLTPEEYGDESLYRTLYEDYYSPVKDSEDNIVGVSVFVIDITERKKMISSLQEAKEKAEEGNRLKTAFINNISHEIRTPLNGILGFGNLVTQSDLSESEREKFYSQIRTSSSRLLKTITNYMDISMIASGTMEIKRKPFALRNMLQQVFKKIQPLCAQKNLLLRLEIPPEHDNVSVISDEEILKTILTHVLDNAVTFTSKGEITYGFEIRPGEVEFFVKDTGSGISKEMHSAIFESFVQASTSSSRGHDGSGLGLSISRGMAKMLGGDIRVKSEPGQGSEFFISIPDTGLKKETIVPAASETAIPALKDPVILVAEDEPTNLLLIKVMLKQTGIRLIEAKNGKEAVALCREHPDISLVVMDLKMPVMDGFEATRQIKSFMQNLPVIAVTAYGLSGDEKRAIEAGCSDYLAKPYHKEILLSKLRRYGII